MPRNYKRCEHNKSPVLEEGSGPRKSSGGVKVPVESVSIMAGPKIISQYFQKIQRFSDHINIYHNILQYRKYDRWLFYDSDDR